MILIRRKSDNVICYEFEDSNTVAIDANGVTADGLGLPLMTSADYEIVTGADANPAGKRYLQGYSYDGSAWAVFDADVKTDMDARVAAGQAAQTAYEAMMIEDAAKPPKKDL
tara:strand:- start:59 stop:394 length:336 start_codon:yes stop_codon:yes gene_type:complete